MTRIRVFDPPLCCSTGVCGPEIDDRLVTFAPEALPLVLVDDAIALRGRYPTRAELAEWGGVALPPARSLPIAGS